MLATFSFSLSHAQARSVEVRVSCGSVGIEYQICLDGAESWARKTGHRVTLITTPQDSDQRLALYQQILSSRSNDLDVYQVDTIWTGILGQHLVDMNRYLPEEDSRDFFPVTMTNNTVGGRLVAVPWYLDTALLYYRRDLLEKHGFSAPKTWSEMEHIAQHIQNAEFQERGETLWGYVFQGRAYEGLTCNALEWIDSFNGGRIVEENGQISINNPRAIAAVDMARGWIGRLSPEGVLNYSEEESRGVFQSGRAVFMRNWPYAWSLTNAPGSPIAGNVGVTSIPKADDGGKTTGVLGGWQLAVSKYSQNPDIAADLVLYLTSAAEQKRRALEGSYSPSRMSLYEDEELLEANEFFGFLAEIFHRAVARPSAVTGLRYNQVSNEFWNAVHQTLNGQTNASNAFQNLDTKLKRISRNERW